MALELNHIIAWSGTIIPDGWTICNGANGTPDLRGKFVYGKYDDADTPDTGGSNTHSHTVGTSSSVGNHSHSYSGSTDNSSSSYYLASSTQYAYGTHSHTLSGTTSSTGSHAHDSTLSSATAIPPYILLYFIMKVA